jgi:uncharacterized membrane protein
MAASFESSKHQWPLSIPFPTAGGRAIPPRPLVWLMRLLCCAALGVTGYLAVTALQEGEVAGCGSGGTFDCSYVLHSRWSKVLGVPVSIPAFALYSVLLLALAFCRRAATKSHQRLAWGVVTLGAFAAGLSAIWFIGLQLFALGHVCKYCEAAHLCGLALSVAILWKRPLGGRMTAGLAGVSVLGVSLLIGTQALSTPPQTYQVEHYPAAVPANSAASAKSDAATKPDTAKPQEKPRVADIFEPPAGIPDDDK